MADESHVQLLKRGVAEWNAWRQKNPEIRPDLSEASLNNSYGSKIELRGINLSGANLSRVNLCMAYLREANLSGADLGGANLSRAYLGEANLSGANLKEANLREAYLGGAEFREADVSGARFGGGITPFRFSELEKLDLISRGANFEKNEELSSEQERMVLSQARSIPLPQASAPLSIPPPYASAPLPISSPQAPALSIPPPQASAPLCMTSTPCYVYAEMDDRVIVDRLTTLEVTVSGDQLEWQSSDTSQSGKIIVNSAKRLIVQVIAKSNFVLERVRYKRTLISWIFQFIRDLVAKAFRTKFERVELAPPKANQQSKFYFDLRATDLGEGEVWVVVRQGQISLLQLSLKPLIVSNRAEARLPTSTLGFVSSTVAPIEQEPTVNKIRTNGSITKFPDQPELLHQLRIIEQRNGNLISYRYELDSPALKIFRDFQSQPFTSERLEYVEHLYQEIESRWVSSADDVEAFTAELRAFGGKLFDELFPEALRSLLWQHHDKIHSIMVISTEPFIPWELVHLKQPGQSHLPEETNFLGQMGLVRWLYGSFPPQTMQIRKERVKYVIPHYPDPRYRLPQAEQEVQFLEKTFQAIAIEPQPTPVRNALETGNFDLLHFAGHGLAEQGNIANAKLMLQGRIENSKYVQNYLSATTVEQYCKLSSSNRPMVVLNACEAGREGYTLTGVGGFAQAFLKGGAGVFVGTLWSVGDRPARRFTETFYEGLMAGLTLAEATITAREASRQSGDATWLAYVVYGHPQLKIEQKSL